MSTSSASPRGPICAIFQKFLCSIRKRDLNTLKTPAINQDDRIQVQRSTIIQPKYSVDSSQAPASGCESIPGIQFMSQAIPTPEPHNARDAQSSLRKVIDSTSTTLTSANRAPRETKDEDSPVPGLVSSISIIEEASNASDSGIRSGGGAQLANTCFAGGGHAFGANSIVINITDELKKAGASQYDTYSPKFYMKAQIRNLPRVEAKFDDYLTKKKIKPCFEGTRVVLLKEMEDWVSSPSESGMYVLSGLAGIGKSTVAFTIASWASRHDLLGASFFFSRDEADHNNAKRFFTTIASQLCAYTDETFAEAIGDALITERGSAATTKDPQEQLQVLIVDPLRSIIQSRTHPILIVVDALDECEDEDGISILNGLNQLVQDLPLFKIILTMRPEPHLDHFFSRMGSHKIFHLQDIDDKVVDDDIRCYLKYNLSLKQVQECFPKKKWCASDEEIESLVRATGRLFIFAATAVRFILDKFASNPKAQMQTLLCAFSQDHAPFNSLNHFYTVILRNVVPADCDNDYIISRYQSVIGAIICVQYPLPVTVLAHLINISAEDIRDVLERLRSVILLGDDDIPRIYHKSFSDYIIGSKRCQDANIRIDLRIRQGNITIRCFQTMEQHLKHNILGLDGLTRFMSNKDGLAKNGITEEQLQKKIPQHLRYACEHWANHLEASNIDAANLIQELEKFADHRMLPWFEMLSLTGKLNLAHRAIRVALNLLEASELYHLLSDGLRFISKFYETIKRSALHTYYSALPFTPASSILYRRYINGIEDDMCHVIGGPDQWDTLVAELVHGKTATNIQFSLDSSMFASWNEEDECSDGTLKVWDAATGTPILSATDNNFAIADSFSMLASFKGKTITFYNVNGNKQGVSCTDRAEILQLAISFDSSQIAAGFSDGILYLWNVRTRESRSFNDYEGLGQGCFQFSSTGARLAYLSAGGVVKLRDGIDGKFIADLDCGSPSPWERVCVNAAFSRDGSYIATLKSQFASPIKSDLKLWICKDGKLVGIAEDAGCELAVSANGSFLATRHYLDTKVKVWSGNKNPLPLVKVIDLDHYAESMTFSVDDTLAITTSNDIRLYDIKNHFFISSLSIPNSTTLAFSPDCSRLAAGGQFGLIYLWDIGGVKGSSLSLNKQDTRATALALSQDCSRLACGFEDGAIELWEIEGPEKQRIAAHRDHMDKVTALSFSPDGKRFASGSSGGTVKLWEGQGGELLEVLNHHGEYDIKWIYSVMLSDNVLAAVCKNDIILWDSRTLDHIHTFSRDFTFPLSLSDNGALLAAVTDYDTSPKVIVFDITKQATIATFDITQLARFDISHQWDQAAGFFPDNSKLVAHCPFTNDFHTYNLIDKEIPKRTTFQDIMWQQPNLPLLHGVPVWASVEQEHGQDCLRAFCSDHLNYPAPVLWIPWEFHVREWSRGRSMVALRCDDGRVVLIRLPTSNYAT